MRYYIATILDKELRDYIRDTMRKLSKYKRYLEVGEIEYLHFNYKYLGKDLTSEEIDEISANIQDWIQTSHISTFEHPLTAIQMGDKSEYLPDVIKLSLKKTDELLDLFRMIQDLIFELGLNNIVGRKDATNLLGVIKLAHIDKNISIEERKILIDIIKQLPPAPAIVVNNISIISTDVFRNKVKTRIYSKHNLD